MTRDASNATERYLPLAYGQRALWFLYDMNNRGHAYNMTYVWHVRSSLDVAVFKDALADLTARHPTLRSTYTSRRGEPVQCIHSEMSPSFDEVDAAHWADDEVRDRLRDEVYRPFKLDVEPPVRWRLFRRGEGKDPILVLGLQHLAADVWSAMTLLNELKKLYNAKLKGETVELSPLEKDNENFVNWQKDMLESAEGAAMLDFWKEQLSGELPVLNLQTDNPRPPAPKFRGESYQFELPRELMDKLVATGKSLGASPFMTCLAAYQAFLHRYTGQEDICVGVPTAGRDDSFAGIFHYYVSPVVMRARPESKLTFAEFLDTVVANVGGALKNQAYPFPLLAQKVQHDMDPSRPPIFQTSFVWENSNRFENRKDPMVFFTENQTEIWDLGDLKLEREIFKLQMDEFDFIMKMVKVGDDYYGLIDYNPDLFRIDTIERTAANFRVWLGGIAEDPQSTIGTLPLLTQAEQERLLVEWNQTDDAYEPLCPYQMFEQRVAEQPDAVALTFEDRSLTYAELNQRANQLARHLRNLGIGPDVLAGISLERSPEMVISQLGIQKAGGAYVPLDPKYPEERIEYILQEAKVAAVLTQDKLADRFGDYDAKVVRLDGDWDTISAHEDTNLDHQAGLNQLSHVIYTSGSTGKPKGVAIEHHSVTALVGWTRKTYSDEELSGMLASTSLNFDLSVYETITTLALGGSIILVENALYLPAAPAKDKVKLINTVPSAIKELIRMKGIPEGVVTINLAGEPLKSAVVQNLYQIPHVEKVYNLYGPSEDTTYSTWALMERDPNYVVMIGQPLTNTQCFVLDANKQLCPIGVPGELWVAGDGLAREYLNRPDLTEERFLPNPYSDAPADDPKSRMYSTGDLVKYWTNSHLECLGRIDHQVKIRGFRIELGEIEAVLQREDNVHEAVVMDREDKSGDKYLCGYVTLKPDCEATSQSLRDYLKELLPDYMVPAYMMILPEMPLNPNGKIDRKQLPEPELQVKAAVSAAPQNEIEHAIAEVWKEVLDLDNVGVNDKFFDVGGNSLVLSRVKFRLEEVFEREFLTTDLFQFPTIKSLAQFISPEEGGVDEYTLRRRRITKADQHDIAVVGIAGRFPGADNVDTFWENLVATRDSITHFTYEELAEAGVDPELLNDSDYVRARGILGDVSLFDAPFFGYSPREAEIMDPQQRFFLEGSWTALESAGYNPDTYAGRIGVFAGTAMSTYFQYNIAPNKKLIDNVGAFQAMVANDKDFIATRVNYNFNLKGPGVNVQSACSTSLLAIHQACKSLLDGESDMALAGGVTIQVPQRQGYMYNEGGIHSPDGKVRAFDAKAKGMVVSSGMGIVVLKRLDEALADGDNILALVKGTGINNDGSNKVGYTAPSVEGQAEAIADAQHFGGVPSETITYIETHGTGTGLGDPIEVAALTKAFRQGGAKENGFCALSALKSNIGHLDSAAGVAGFIKAVLSLKHKQIPAIVNFEQANPSIPFENTPFYVNGALQDWNPPEGVPRRAGISAFGIGGTNAHAVLEEAPVLEATGESRGHQLITLSAKTATALEKTTANLLAFLKHNPDTTLGDAAFTLNIGRKSFAKRRVFVCKDAADAVDVLETHDAKRMITSTIDPQERPVVFMFSGQGAQYINMARDLYQQEADFRADVDHCCEYLKSHLNLDLRDLWFVGDLEGDAAKEAAGKLNQTSMTQPALFVIEYALAQQWLRWGVKPAAMIGHSIGEYVAACLAGVFSLEAALALVAARGRLMQSQPPGKMMAIPMDEKDVEPYLTDKVNVATINAPNRCVVAGDDASLEDLMARLKADGKKGTILHTSHAFHSWMMDDILAPFTAEVAKVELQTPQIPYVSNVTGDWITAEQATSPDYYAQHLRNAVRFAEGMQTLGANADRIYLEVGPGKTLMTFAKQVLGRDVGPRALMSVRHIKDQVDDQAFMLENLGKLWSLGVDVDWSAFYEGETRRRMPLPTYPFEHRRYWVEPVEAEVVVKKTAAAPLRKRENLADWFYTPVWRQSVPPSAPAPAGKVLVFTQQHPLAEGLVAKLREQGHDVVTATPGSYGGGGDAYTINPAKREDYVALFGAVGQVRHMLHLWNLTGEPSGDRRSFAEHCTENGFMSLVYIAQAMDEHNLGDRADLLVISDQMQKVGSESVACPEKAPLLGACKVIPREYPNLMCRSIDVIVPSAGSADEARLIGYLCAETGLNSADIVVAYRDRYRWIQSVEPSPLHGTSDTTKHLREGGVYLITGGLGGIGLAIAEFFAANAKAKLVLTRRSSLPERDQWDQWLSENSERDKTSYAIRKIRELEAKGAEVMVGVADVSDAEAMAGVIRETRARFGDVHGVVHAAGLFPSGMIAEETAEKAQRVLAPKLQGLLILTELLRDQPPLDFMALFSSTSAMLGNMGFADYCAANAYLDAYANHYDDAATRVLSMCWDGWKEVGMAVDQGMTEDQLRNMMDPTEGVEAFRRILCESPFPQVLVSPMDFVTMMDEIHEFLTSSIEEDTEDASEHGAEEETALTAPAAGGMSETENAVAELWRDSLGVDDVAPTDDFHDLGGDSLLATMIASKLRKMFKIKLPPKTIGEHPTVRDLSRHIDGLLGKTPAAPKGGGMTATEQTIADLWRDSLGVNAVGLDDDFHDLGGDSLLATMVASKLRKTFKIKLSPQMIGEHPTVRGLAKHIDGEIGGGAEAKPGSEPVDAAKTEAAPSEAPAAEAAPVEAAKPERRKRPNLRAAYVEPSNDTERQIAELYAETFGFEQVGVNDNFLELGGHTELATELAEKLSELFQIELPPGAPINDPTVVSVAERIETLRWATQNDDASLDGDDEEEFEL